MKRRTWIQLGLVSLVVAIGAFGVQRCVLTFAPPTEFSYGGHEQPRVFVSHHPLIPGPGDNITIKLVPDLAASEAVSEATAVLRNDAGEPVESRECPPAADSGFECQFSLPATTGVMAYSGSLELTNGDVVSSRAIYRFTVAESMGPDQLIEARIPINTTEGLAETCRVDAAWTRDPTGYDIEAFVGDVEQDIYNGVLRDPAYCWRDDQLGFWVYTREAFVTSYYSGIDTRCRKNPWPRDSAFPAVLADIEVLGVLHRKGTAAGIEGRVATPISANLFRDCAGQAVRGQKWARSQRPQVLPSHC